MILRENMYIRYRDPKGIKTIGKILTVHSIDKTKVNRTYCVLDNSSRVLSDFIINSNSDILELIEEEDVIRFRCKNIYGIKRVEIHNGKKVVHIINDTYFNLDEIEIIEVLTKEQFKKESYKVGV